MTRDLIIYGAGTFGEAFLDIAHACGRNVVAFVDDAAGDGLCEVAGVPVIGEANVDKFSPDTVRFVSSIGDPQAREEAFQAMQFAGYRPDTLIHPGAQISPHATVGEGSVINTGTFVNRASSLGRGVLMSAGSVVAHHTQIGDFALIALGVSIGGSVIIGDRVFFGIGSTVSTNIGSIGDDVTVGAGAVVVNSVHAGQTMVGVPAAPLGNPIRAVENSSSEVA